MGIRVRERSGPSDRFGPVIKAYGVRCNKCVGHDIVDTQAPFLVYADKKAGPAGAEALLQDAIKEHDIEYHGDDGEWPDVTILVMYSKKPRKRKARR